MPVDYLARLTSMTAATTWPVLDGPTLADLLVMFSVRDALGFPPRKPWQALTPYMVAGEIRVPTVDNEHLYKVTTAGVSGATEPTWPTGSGATVTDGSVVWTEDGPNDWTPTYNLSAAAAEGWRRKASLCSGKYNLTVGAGQSFSRDQVFQHCLKMAELYGRGGVGSLRQRRDYHEQRELEHGWPGAGADMDEAGLIEPWQHQ